MGLAAGRGGGEEYRYVTLSPLTGTQFNPALLTKMGSDESHFNVSVGSDGH